MKKKILAFALCMLLVANPCFAASTGVVTVLGGSIATGGLALGFSEITESAALTLTMAMLYGLGVSVKLSHDAINAGQSAYSFVKTKFYEWVGGTSAEQLDDSQYEELKRRFEVITGGSNIDPDGNIYFNATAVDLIRRFLNWLDSSDYINDYSGSGSADVASINNVSTFYGNRFNYIFSNIPPLYLGTSTTYGSGSIQNPVNVLIYNIYNKYDSSTYYRFYVFKGDMDNVVVNSYRQSDNAWFGLQTRISLLRNGYYYIVDATTYNISDHIPAETFINTTDDTRSYSKVAQDFLDGADGNVVIGEESEVVDGFNYEGDFDPSILNNPDDNNLVVKPDLVQGLRENNPNQQINIPVEQYLEALKQILNQATNPQAVPEPIPAQDLPTLSPVPVDVPADLPLEWPVELPSSPDATPDLPTDNTPVTDPSTPVNPVDALPELTFNLDEYFPFCIPFDVYHLLSKFSADPVTPVFDIGFTEPFTNTNVNFHIDLSPWDSVASAIRTAELGAFIVGLAVASRAIFTKG